MYREWGEATSVLSTHALSNLLRRARRTSCAPAQNRPIDAPAPIVDDDPAPVPPPPEPAKPTEGEPRERKERTSIPRIVVRAPAYPVYRGRRGSLLARVALCACACGAVVAAIAAVV